MNNMTVKMPYGADARFENVNSVYVEDGALFVATKDKGTTGIFAKGEWAYVRAEPEEAK